MAREEMGRTVKPSFAEKCSTLAASPSNHSHLEREFRQQFVSLQRE